MGGRGEDCLLLGFRCAHDRQAGDRLGHSGARSCPKRKGME